MTNSHNLGNKSINILSKQLCFSKSTNLKIFLESNTVVNMAANMAVRSMYNWLLSKLSVIILTKCIHCCSPVGDRISLFDSTNKTIADIGRTNTRLTKVYDSEFPMYSCTLRTYPFLSL